jgi:hypothetical protein
VRTAETRRNQWRKRESGTPVADCPSLPYKTGRRNAAPVKLTGWPHQQLDRISREIAGERSSVRRDALLTVGKPSRLAFPALKRRAEEVVTPPLYSTGS